MVWIVFVKKCQEKNGINVKFQVEGELKQYVEEASAF